MWNGRNMILDPLDLDYNYDVKEGQSLTINDCNIE
jgi:hypothetical protein